MSRRDKTWYWRHVRCDGCERACRYRDFRPDPPIPSFYEIYYYLKVKIEQGDSRYRYKRRGTILGMMHAQKRASWEEATENCAYQNRKSGHAPEGRAEEPGPGPEPPVRSEEELE